VDEQSTYNLDMVNLPPRIYPEMMIQRARTAPQGEHVIMLSYHTVRVHPKEDVAEQDEAKRRSLLDDLGQNIITIVRVEEDNHEVEFSRSWDAWLKFLALHVDSDRVHSCWVKYSNQQAMLVSLTKRSPPPDKDDPARFVGTYSKTVAFNARTILQQFLQRKHDALFNKECPVYYLHVLSTIVFWNGSGPNQCIEDDDDKKEEVDLKEDKEEIQGISVDDSAQDVAQLTSQAALLQVSDSLSPTEAFVAADELSMRTTAAESKAKVT
jgi:hypothetical protein